MYNDNDIFNCMIRHDERVKYDLITDAKVPWHFKSLTGLSSVGQLVKIFHPDVSFGVYFKDPYRYYQVQFILQELLKDTVAKARLDMFYILAYKFGISEGIVINGRQGQSKELTHILFGRWIYCFMSLILRQSFPRYKNYLYDFNALNLDSLMLKKKHKGEMSLNGFVKYAKEEFGCDIICVDNGKPDTFEDIFGTSFLAKNERNNRRYFHENNRRN